MRMWIRWMGRRRRSSRTKRRRRTVFTLRVTLIAMAILFLDLCSQKKKCKVPFSCLVVI
jgi:hypothetical protein